MISASSRFGLLAQARLLGNQTAQRAHRHIVVNGHRRDFHLAGQDAVNFLAKQAPKVSTEQGSAPSQQSERISILLHADRRPLTVAGSSDQHFGPALLGCQSTVLQSGLADVDRKTFGKGDIGLMQLSERDPSQVTTEPILAEKGLDRQTALRFVQQITDQQASKAAQWQENAASALVDVWNLFRNCEGAWFTFSIASDDAQSIIVQDPFFEFDDFAVHRIEALKDVYAQRQRDPNTARAEDGGLFYIKLPSRGNVGSFGYGAGNAMATMDGLALMGGRPANFLDGGGGANKANAKLAIETLNNDGDVKSIFVNTFGGITQTDVVAEGIIEAVREHQIKTPITVRVLGTGAERAKELLRDSDLGFSIEDDFKTAARAAVERATSS